VLLLYFFCKVSAVKNKTAIGLPGSLSVSGALSTSNLVPTNLDEKVKQFPFSGASGNHQFIHTTA
jgi:hypothetical protein